MPNETELAVLLAGTANIMGFKHDAFSAELCREHRTIQQSVMRVMVEHIRRVANQEEYDLRNQASVTFAKALIQAERDGVIKMSFPTI